MSDRILQLEQALKEFNADHTLLNDPDLLSIKSGIELYGDNQKRQAEDSPQFISSDFEDTSSSASRTMTQSPTIASSNPPAASPASTFVDPKYDLPSMDKGLGLSDEVMTMSHNFPFDDQTGIRQSGLARRQYIRNFLPSREVTEYLWEQAKQNALWQYNPHPNATFMPNLIRHVYDSDLESLCPRRLALILMILAVGTLVDLAQPAESPDSERYYHLARASLCEIPVMEETTVAAIVTLFYMTWYLLVFSDQKKAADHAWGLMGLTAKLAQQIGLHRDSTLKSKMIFEDVEQRRSLFWELMYLDARLSLSLGRPPSLFLKHMDCRRPLYCPPDDSDPAESLHYFQEWKHSCYVECLSPVLEVISSPNLEYKTVLDLDAKIREFSTPAPFRSDLVHSRPFIMQKASLSTALEAVILQLHRTFFTRALSGPEEAFNRRHQYAPSVVAVFLSASRMIATVEALYNQEPALSSRILWYWSNAFSAAVALCLLVSRAPFTCLSPAALHELRRARLLFTAAKDSCPRAQQVVPILETMVEKATQIYDRWAEGQESPKLALRAHDDPKPAAPHTTKEDYIKAFMQHPPAQDAFDMAHPSLTQCIVEVHQRALSLFPMRKPCTCTHRMAHHLPPQRPLLPAMGPHSIQTQMRPSVSRLAAVDSLNFDFGSLNSANSVSNGWLAWF